jgi:hypothetical protein
VIRSRMMRWFATVSSIAGFVLSGAFAAALVFGFITNTSLSVTAGTPWLNFESPGYRDFGLYIESSTGTCFISTTGWHQTEPSQWHEVLRIRGSFPHVACFAWPNYVKTTSGIGCGASFGWSPVRLRLVPALAWGRFEASQFRCDSLLLLDALPSSSAGDDDRSPKQHQWPASAPPAAMTSAPAKTAARNADLL